MEDNKRSYSNSLEPEINQNEEHQNESEIQENSLFKKLTDFFSNMSQSHKQKNEEEAEEITSTDNNEISSMKSNKSQKNEVVYEEIVKEKKKKRVPLSFCGISVQNQKIIFRIIFIVIHIILFFLFFCMNDFQFTIPYRL